VRPSEDAQNSRLTFIVSFVKMQFQGEFCLGQMELPGPGNEQPQGTRIGVRELKARFGFGSFSPVHDHTGDPEGFTNSLDAFKRGPATDGFDLGSSSSLSVPWDSFLAGDSRLDRLDLVFGEEDVSAPACQGAFGDGEEVHDLPVGRPGGECGPARHAPSELGKASCSRLALLQEERSSVEHRVRL
jgi:hypothetical protein